MYLNIRYYIRIHIQKPLSHQCQPPFPYVNCGRWSAILLLGENYTNSPKVKQYYTQIFRNLWKNTLTFSKV